MEALLALADSSKPPERRWEMVIEIPAIIDMNSLLRKRLRAITALPRKKVDRKVLNVRVPCNFFRK